MNVKVNKEISTYKEGIFFGLSVRQLLCAIGAVGVAVGVYFALREPLGRETVSWLCILCAAPVAAAGFFQFHGMSLERFAVVWFLSEVLFAGKRVYKSVNLYDTALLPEPKERRQKKHGIKTHKKAPRS